MSERLTSLGGLSCRVFQGAGQTRPELAVVLCHGFGAPGDDLVPFGMEVVSRRPELSGRVRWVFPEAPLELRELGYAEARAWWTLDFERLQSLQLEGPRGRGMRDEVPEGLAKSRKLLMALVDELSRSTGLPVGKIVLGGFSQGAMLTTDVALRLEEAPAALAIFSGTLLNEADWSARAARRKGLRVLQSHGRADPLLRYQDAEALRDLLSGAGLEVDFVPFEGGHTIPLPVVDKLATLVAGAAG